MKVTDEAKINEIVGTYSFEKQREILTEECAELIQAVQKLKRAEDTGIAENISAATKNYIEELADVTIMVEQMTGYLTPRLFEDYSNKITQKLDRQIERIKLSKQREKEEYDKWRSNVKV